MIPKKRDNRLRRGPRELALGYYESFADEHRDDSSVQEDLAEALMRVGEIKFELGSIEKGREVLEQALAVREKLAAQSPQDLKQQLALGDIVLHLAKYSPQPKRAELGRRAIKIVDQLQRFHPESDEVFLAQVRAYSARTAPTAHERLEHVKQALDLLAARDMTDPYLNEIELCESAAGNTYFRIAGRSKGDEKDLAYRNAIVHFKNATDAQKRLVEQDPSLENQYKLAVDYLNLGAAQTNLAHGFVEQELSLQERASGFRESLETTLRAAAVLKTLREENPLVAKYGAALRIAICNAGECAEQMFLATGESSILDKAMEYYVRSVNVGNRNSRQSMELVCSLALKTEQRTDVDDEKKDAYLEEAISFYLKIPDEERGVSDWSQLGQLLYATEKYSESRIAFEKCIELRDETIPTSRFGPRWWYMTKLFAREGKREQALEYFTILELESLALMQDNSLHRDEAAELLGVEIFAEDLSDDPSKLLDQTISANIRNWRMFYKLGNRLRHAGQQDQARRAYQAAIGVIDETPIDHRSTGLSGYLGQMHYWLGQYEESRKAFHRNLELRGEANKPTIDLGPRWWFLAMLLARAGETEKARHYYETLVNDVRTNPTSDPTAGDECPRSPSEPGVFAKRHGLAG